jgi:exopolysaccharide biosynthesis polyprenyl glycosylphosphotransferase
MVADQLVAETVASGSSTALVAASAMDTELSTRLLRRLVEAGIHVEVTSTLRDVDHRRLRVRPIGPFPVMYVEPVIRNGWRATAKRSFDVVGAGVGLLLLSPVVALAALAVRLDSKGPIFYGQTRVGRGNRPFRIWKFRTMVPDADSMVAELADRNEADGPLFKIADDPRITRVGRILRKTSIDELPQLWNVLRNEMSLVGPRPGLPAEAVQWDAEVRERLRVKPGITGMWQVSGRSDSSFDEYARLDLYYVHNWSLLVDLGILLRTIPTVLWSKGAY